MSTLAYSTSVTEPSRRFDYWTDVVCHHCVLAASRMIAQGAFDAQFQMRTVGAVEVSTMNAPLHHWKRDAAHLRRGPDDDLWIACMIDGDAVVGQNERSAILSSGDMVLYDAARPFDITLTAQTIHVLRLPRRSLLQRCPGAEQLTALTIDAGQAAAGPLRSMIEQAVSIDFASVRPNAASQFGSTLLDLVAVALEMRIGVCERPGDNDLYSRIVAYIHRHFEDPDLCLESLASAHQVSSRTVTRAFARHAQTAIGLVWQLRLEASQRALAEGRSCSVKQAAFDHGFSDVSHFSRAFRKSFGYAPHTLIRS